MDFSKIKLANERNTHVTKRLNRLSAWKFFKVIYRENVWRLFGYNFLMLICLLPIFAALIYGTISVSTVEQTLPMLNSFGFSTGAWTNVSDYLTQQTMEANIFTGWMTVVASLLVMVILSGGLAVIRDAFWTGKLSTVGVFKSMWMGIKANILYGFVSTVIIAMMVFGIYVFCAWLSELILWLAIVLTIVLAVVALFVATYLLILCSVSVTYKQSLRDNLSDSWRLLWLNVLPNLLHVLMALLPIALYFVFGTGLFQMVFMMLLVMFGGMYFPFVWQTHMMKTFALFHPVEAKKKKGAKQSSTVAEIEEYPTFEPTPAKPKKKDKKQSDTETTEASTAVEATDSIAESEADAYAMDNDDPYATHDDEHNE